MYQDRERRVDVTDLTRAITALETSHTELIKELRGNGQPGFIAQTRSELDKLARWQAEQDALKENAQDAELALDRKLKRYILLGTLLITGVEILFHLGGKL